MVQLLEQDITTTEVFDWQGIHLIHFAGSSCSQKTRIFLNLKGIDWVSHHLNLARQENYEPWFLGINPRGLVPVLVHDGVVHIESNDILTYLDQTFPDPPLIPAERHNEIQAGLAEEDALHMAIRTLTMRFMAPRKLVEKNPEGLERYADNPGTIRGEKDPHRAEELSFWRGFAETGITDAQAREAVQQFRAVYQRLETQMGSAPYLLGPDITLLDVAWFIYTHRLAFVGYPFADQHPGIERWYRSLLARDEFSREVAMPAAFRFAVGARRAWQGLTGASLARIGGLA